MSTDMRVRVDGETTDTTGSDVNFDDTFGIGDFDRFRAEASWRIAPRHVLRAMYFQNNRHATRSIERDVEFQDQTFPVGATVNASSELTIAQVSYDYAFLRRDNYEIAGGIGIHYVDMGLKLDATVTAQGNQASRSLDAGATTAAPLPVLGLRGLWRLSDSFYIAGQVQYFYLEFDPYSGSLIDLKASAVWQVDRSRRRGARLQRLRFSLRHRGHAATSTAACAGTTAARSSSRRSCSSRRRCACRRRGSRAR